MSVFYNPICAVSIGMFIATFFFTLMAILIYRKSEETWVERTTGNCWKMKPYKVSPIDDPSKVLHIMESTYNGQVIVVDNVELDRIFRKG